MEEPPERHPSLVRQPARVHVRGLAHVHRVAVDLDGREQLRKPFVDPSRILEGVLVAHQEVRVLVVEDLGEGNPRGLFHDRVVRSHALEEESGDGGSQPDLPRPRRHGEDLRRDPVLENGHVGRDLHDVSKVLQVARELARGLFAESAPDDEVGRANLDPRPLYQRRCTGESPTRDEQNAERRECRRTGASANVMAVSNHARLARARSERAAKRRSC